jgi:hypothetical protein
MTNSAVDLVAGRPSAREKIEFNPIFRPRFRYVHNYSSRFIVWDAHAFLLLRFSAGARLPNLRAVTVPIGIPSHAALAACSAALIEGMTPSSPVVHRDSL